MARDCPARAGERPARLANLSVSAVAITVCKILVANPSLIPPDTEGRSISFAGEEAGLRGASRCVERHLDEVTRLDARHLNMEMIAHPEITILPSEESGTVKNSPLMVQTVVAAAERAIVPYQ